MKCQNCGKQEVNLHYSSSINGQVSQVYLCSDCAEELGFDFGKSFNVESVFGGLFPILGSFFRSNTFGIPECRTIPVYPWAVSIGPDNTPHAGDCSCGNVQCAPVSNGAQIDEEMKKRRELNMLREQMRHAAEKDEFEEAIKIREKINELENGMDR